MKILVVCQSHFYTPHLPKLTWIRVAQHLKAATQQKYMKRGLATIWRTNRAWFWWTCGKKACLHSPVCTLNEARLNGNGACGDRASERRKSARNSQSDKNLVLHLVYFKIAACCQHSCDIKAFKPQPGNSGAAEEFTNAAVERWRNNVTVIANAFTIKDSYLTNLLTNYWIHSSHGYSCPISQINEILKQSGQVTLFFLIIFVF